MCVCVCVVLYLEKGAESGVTPLTGVGEGGQLGLSARAKIEMLWA